MINLKVCDVINCLNKNLTTRFVWYLKKEKRYDIEPLSIKKGTVLLESHAENVHQWLFPDPFSTLVNNPKKPLHAGNSFKNKIF